MKKLLTLAITTMVVFMGFMWLAEKYTVVNDFIMDAIYWFDLEQWIMPTLVVVSFIIASVAYAIADVCEAIVYDMWCATKFVFTKVFHKETA